MRTIGFLYPLTKEKGHAALKEIMTPSVDAIAPRATAADATRRVKDLDVGAIPVCDGSNLLGMVTDRDLVVRVMAASRDPVLALVSEAMTPGIYSCYDDEEAESEKLEEALWSGVVQSKQLRSLYETILKEDVLPAGIDRDTVQRRVDQLRRQENEIRAVVTDTPASPSPS